METGKEPRLDDPDSAPADMDVAEESINMADPHIDSTFMPSTDLSEELQDAEAMFSVPDDLTADWAQWMRWDDIEDTKSTSFSNSNVPGSTLPHTAFSFPSDDAILSTHAPGSSNGQLLAPSTFNQLPVSPTFQGLPTNLAAQSTQQPTPQSDASSPLAPSPTSSLRRKRKSSHDDSPGNNISASTPVDKSAPSKKR
ncbi:hypothetical protein FQN49_005417, partial [Arthroderma sp. PD_2]